jgi:ankyrin repeat protein
MARLFKCARRNDLPGLQLLLKHNWSIDSKTYDDETILHIAAERGSVDILKFGISEKLNVNARTHFCQETPLHLAVQENQTECVNLLLAAGADPKLENNEVFLSFSKSFSA